MINLHIDKQIIKDHFKYYVVGVIAAIFVFMFSFIFFYFVTDNTIPPSYIDSISIYELPRQMISSGVSFTNFNENIDKLFQGIQDTKTIVQFPDNVQPGHRINPFVPKI